MTTLVAHEWMAPQGGSENVLEEILKVLPDAELLALWNDAPTRFAGPVRETFLARTPLRRSKALALPVMPFAWRSVDITRYESIVVSSHAFAHQLATRAAREGRAGYAYVHTPARYVWSPELDPRGQGVGARLVAPWLRRQDRAGASNLVRYAANSRFVRERIRAAWGVDATVIYPPVDVATIQGRLWKERVDEPEAAILSSLPDEFLLGASRLVPYKRLDLTIRAGEALGCPVVIAGDGPARPELERTARAARVPVHFVGRVSDAALYSLYERARALVFMAIEDFGIMPVEAMSLGTPVVVQCVGGAAESVALVGGGVAVDASEPSVEHLRAALSAADCVDSAAAADACLQYFDAETFRVAMRNWIAQG